MRTQVRRWGKGLALRIPSRFAKTLGLYEAAEVDITVDSDFIRIRKVGYTLDKLLAEVTPENIHLPTDSGRSTGRKAW